MNHHFIILDHALVIDMKMVFYIIKEIMFTMDLQHIKDNKLNKNKCHDIVKNNPTATRYIVKRSKK